MKSDERPKKIRFESLSKQAKNRIQLTEEKLRKLGFDDVDVRLARDALMEFYNPSTGDFDLDEEEFFEELVVPLLASIKFTETLTNSIALLDHPRLESLYFSAEELSDVILEFHKFHNRIGDAGDGHAMARLFMVDEPTDERVAAGELLYRGYLSTIDEHKERQVYDVLKFLCNDADEEVRKLAEEICECFGVMPIEANYFLQLLFIKSLVRIFESFFIEETTEEEKEDVAELVETIEACLANLLLLGEESYMDMMEEDDEEDWDEDDWDEVDLDEMDGEDESDEEEAGNNGWPRKKG